MISYDYEFIQNLKNDISNITIEKEISDSEKKINQEEISDKEKYLLTHKIETLKSIN